MRTQKERKFRSVEALRINQVKEELRSEEIATEQAMFALKREREEGGEEYKKRMRRGTSQKYGISYR